MNDLYESPITRIVANVQSQIEEQEGRILMKVVHNAGFDVDKHELMKALAYDRHQYEKGKSDAMKNAVPLDKLCEFLADTLHTPVPCFNNEEICPRMDFGYCRLPDAPDVKECWKKILAKWMEGLDAAD